MKPLHPDKDLKVAILQLKRDRFEWQLRAKDGAILKKGYAVTVPQARRDGEQARQDWKPK